MKQVLTLDLGGKKRTLRFNFRTYQVLGELYADKLKKFPKETAKWTMNQTVDSIGMTTHAALVVDSQYNGEDLDVKFETVMAWIAELSDEELTKLNKAVVNSTSGGSEGNAKGAKKSPRKSKSKSGS